MKYSIKYGVMLLCAAALLNAAACGKAGGQPDGSSSQPAESAVVQGSDVQAVETDLSSATQIVLSGSSASVEGKGAVAEGGVVIITEAGVYEASGSLEDGRIIVNAPGGDVTVALSGADITCSYGSPIYIYKAGTATVYLSEGTENALADGSAYTYDDEYSSAADEEPNACLYSKADLVIGGAGKLSVTANCDNGITSKDTLIISDSTIVVSAVDNGINGKDSNTILGADITVSCGGDAIRSTNDTDGSLGWISVTDSTLDLTAGEDGIQAETALSMDGVSCTVTSGGGSGAQLSEDASAKGLKAGTELSIADGTYILDCADDAVHANGDVTVSGGEYTVSTGDDGFHADGALTVSGGEIEILESYEGLEGSDVEISGGDIRISSSDDGVNSAGGADGSGFGGFDRGNAFGGQGSDHSINITGGRLVVRAGGDGLDSNGKIVMSGGEVIVSSTGQGDGALDYDVSFTLTGGTLLAVDSGGMPQAPDQAEQYIMSLGFDSILSAGTFVSFTGESGSFVFQLPVDTGHMVVSVPGFEGGAEYTVSYGGDYSGESNDGICSGGTYSGGTNLTELTLSDFITTYGNQGAGMMGGFGGRPGGAMDGGPKGGRGEMPADGEAPAFGEMPPKGEPPADGEMPERGEWADSARS